MLYIITSALSKTQTRIELLTSYRKNLSLIEMNITSFRVIVNSNAR